MSHPIHSPLLEDLITRCCAGDLGATRALAERLMPFAAGLVRSCVSDRRAEERDEILGQILVWMVEDLQANCQRFDANRGTPLAYFRSVFRAYLSRYFRDAKAGKRQILIFESEPSEPEDQGLNAEQALAGGAPKRLVQDWILTLRRRDQMIMRRRVLGQSTSKEIAELLGTTPAAIDTQVRRLKQALKEWLERSGVAELALVLLLAPLWGLARWWLTLTQ